MNYKEKKDCICCNSGELTTILDLNKQPLTIISTQGSEANGKTSIIK